MKKSLNLLPILLVVSAFTGISGEHHTSITSENPQILIIPIPSDIPDAPRMPVYNPFFAELMNGYVILGSSSSYGTVSVSLTSTAGDDYSTILDTTDGAIILPISGAAGFYTILITTPGGAQFVGEFTIN